MTRAKAPPPFVLRVRTHANRPGFVRLQLLLRDGPADQWVLFGEPDDSVATRLVALFEGAGVAVEREDSPAAVPGRVTPPGGLFDGVP